MSVAYAVKDAAMYTWSHHKTMTEATIEKLRLETSEEGIDDELLKVHIVSGEWVEMQGTRGPVLCFKEEEA